MFTDNSIHVFRNNEITLEKVNEYDKILLSPGPGLPKEAGILIPLIKKYAPTKNILGICLGLQAIVEAFGGKLNNLEKVYHGVKTPMKIIQPNEILFKNMPTVFMGGRYHSWVADKNTLPNCLQTTIIDNEDNIMAVSHKTLQVKAVQFHPESILTEFGKKIIQNWIEQ
jgi:anthranilate synthase component 2